MYNTITRFEWDQEKAKKNWRKQGITFEQAKYAFDDPFAVHLADDDHSDHEERFAIIGMTPIGLLFVSFTYRHGTIRIISTRRANPAMHRIYANEE